MASQPRKRQSSSPCSICRKWFTPSARTRRQQRTCLSPECRKAQKARSQAEWRKANQSYYSERRLAEQIARAKAGEEVSLRGPPTELRQTPRRVVQDEMSHQALVIILFFVRMLNRSAQDVMRRQLIDFKAEFGRVPLTHAQDVIASSARSP
jgi:hypothetical protein